jgi:hypothetical protein
MEIIYQDPTTYFDSEVLPNEEIYRYPPREIFEKFFTDSLCYFTAFSTPNHFDRQLSGCSMGAKTSPVLASILCSLYEKEFIYPLVASGTIIHYSRYVDDVLCICAKDVVENIFNNLNSWDPAIKFTKELSLNNRIKFLDTEIYQNKNTEKLEFKTYRKPTQSLALQNFSAVSPKSHKSGLLYGVIHRMNNTCTNNQDLENSLSKLEKQFISNGYPKNMVKNTINEARDNNFETKEKDSKIEVRHYLQLDFTSQRCDKIARKISNIIQKATPTFKVIITFKTIRLRNALSFRLKAKIPNELKAGLSYEFECPCGEKYIGETLRTLNERSSNHCVPSSSTNVRNHFESCPTFIWEFHKTTAEPNSRAFTKYAKQHFKIVYANLKEYRHRILIESFMIKIKRPKLNDQVKSAQTIFL